MQSDEGMRKLSGGQHTPSEDFMRFFAAAALSLALGFPAFAHDEQVRVPDDRTKVEKAGDKAGDTVDDAAHNGCKSVGDATKATGEKASEVARDTKSTAERAGDKASDTAHDAKAEASSAGTKAKHKARRARKDTANAAGNAADSVGDTAHKASDKAHEKAQQ
jgi:hypothetical protein